MTGSTWTRRRLLRAGTAAAGAGGLVGASAAHEDPLEAVSQEALVDGYQVRQFGQVRLPTALSFGPGVDGSADLYVASIPRSGYEDLVLPEAAADQVKSATGGNGTVERLHVTYTPAGPIVTDTTTVVTGLEFPLGVAVDDDGALYVSDNRRPIPTDETFRTRAAVYRVETLDGTGEKAAIVEGIPSGPIHDANHLAFGPDGRLHLAVGSTSCNGKNHDVEIHPYTGSILRVDVDDLVGNPARLHWTDADGNLIESDSPAWDNVNRQIAQHARNDDFNERVEVVARGFRNVFGLAFGPDGVLHTGMNGSQTPASQDVFYRLDEIGASGVPDGDDDRRLDAFAGIPHYGFPYALNFTEGDADGTGRETRGLELRPNPKYDADPVDVDPSDYVGGDALMGWHVCATGLDFPTAGDYAFPSSVHGDAYIAECGAYEFQTTVDRTLEGHDSDNTGHKVTRVELADDGTIEGYQDWLTGFSSPTDVAFGPEGAMYVADLDNGVFVAHPDPGGDTGGSL